MSRVPDQGFYIPLRYFIVLATFLLSLLLYIDRICISVAKDPIAGDLMLSDKQMGWIFSAFTLGYALFQTPSGWLADKFGPRRILTMIVTLWSIFTALTAAAYNFVMMLIVRFLFGVGESGAFPNISRVNFSWIPIKERGLVTGINFSGSRLGGAFALPLVGWLVATVGWKTSFIILGLVGIVWAAIWYWFFRDEPANHPWINQHEKNHILTARQQPEQKITPLSGQMLFGNSSMWLNMTQYFCSNFIFYFTLGWMYPYIKSKDGLDYVTAGLWASIPLLAGACGNWFSGWWVDRIYRKGQWVLSRRMPAMVGFTLAATSVLALVFVEQNVALEIALLSIAIFGADMTLSPSWSLCVDIGKRHAGAVSGTMNMAGNIGAFITILAFPYLKAWFGSVTPFFVIAAVLCVLAIFCWSKLDPERPLVVE